MANLIQIKRSATTAVPTSLANGELAYTTNGEILFIGSEGNVKAIGGERFPGTLTANQALVANATSYINEIKTAKLFLTDGTANVTHINAVANSTTLGLAVNTEITTTWAIKEYVDGKTALLGGAITNTQIVYSDSGTLSGSAAFIFDNTSNTITISGPLAAGNTEITGFANISSTLAAGDTTITGFVNASGSGVFGTTLSAGNTTITGFANISSTLVAGNTTISGFANISSTLAAGNTTISGFANLGGVVTAGNTTVSGFINVTSTGEFGGNVTISGVMTANNGSVIGGDATSNVVFNSKISSDLIPFHTGQFSLGNTSFDWLNAYIDNIYTTTASVSGDLTVSGNLLVSGDVVTLNTTNLNIEDPLIRLANGNATTDAVDIGLWGTFGNATVTQSTGFFRDATDGEWKLFAGEIPDLSTATTIDTANVNFSLANLQVFKLTANTVATGNAQITGGQITGIVDLTVADGGTGVSVFANNGIIYGQNTNALAVTAAGTEGQVLQAGSGGVPLFASLDGGTF